MGHILINGRFFLFTCFPTPMTPRVKPWCGGCKWKKPATQPLRTFPVGCWAVSRFQWRHAAIMIILSILRGKEKRRDHLSCRKVRPTRKEATLFKKIRNGWPPTRVDRHRIGWPGPNILLWAGRCDPQPSRQPDDPGHPPQPKEQKKKAFRLYN